jgi:hypothetical protein
MRGRTTGERPSLGAVRILLGGDPELVIFDYYTEWLVIEITFRLGRKATLDSIADRSTGQIACRFLTAVTSFVTDDQTKAELVAVAEDWKKLAVLRDDVVHARPATDEHGCQRLHRRAPTRPAATTGFITEEVLAHLSEQALSLTSRLSPLRDDLPAREGYG